MIEPPLLERAPQPGSPNDTKGDRLARFAVGAAIAGLGLLVGALAGVGEGLGAVGLAVVCALAILLAGIMSVIHGERFVERLLKAVSWM